MSSQNLLYNLYFYKALGYKFIDKNQIYNPKIEKNGFLNLDILNKDIKNCNLCELCKSRTHAVLGKGASNIMLVAKSPNSNSDKTGSAIDDELFKVLEEVNIDKKAIYFTFLIKCKTSGPDKEIWYEQCKMYFKHELKLVRPKIIVTLGQETFFYITKCVCAFESVRGGIFEFKDHFILPTYSHEWVKKNPSYMNEFKKDLEKLKGYE
ncbi:uracil-DNA glycosylase family protein [Campylobacter hyointestinalis]|uniref:uracil-DNA glycosylase family protein n=1 Tax=Campylobacter hyointestinalis TaxID=198 RepID=UPI000DCD1850|nr:uracil-DNA glycosylase family protein [Campylobacter hyointestinalis]RAZ52671.1 uracil-DNA glycosylase [Campylobacter hyointestinalis subsp. lawsonii]